MIFFRQGVAGMYARIGRGRENTGLPVTDRRGRAIGRILGRDYCKTVSRPDQMLHAPPGFGFDAWAMENLVLPRVDYLTVTCTFSGRIYRTSAETFRRFRITIDRGAGRQFALPLDYWQEEVMPARPHRRRTTPAPPALPTPAPAAALEDDRPPVAITAEAAPGHAPVRSLLPAQGRLF